MTVSSVFMGQTECRDELLVPSLVSFFTFFFFFFLCVWTTMKRKCGGFERQRVGMVSETVQQLNSS